MKKQFFILALCISFINLNAQKNNSLLWRITKPGSDSSSYLFGTIHLPQEKFMKLPDSLYYAINHTAVFYAEIDMLNMASELDELTEFSKHALSYMDSVQKTSSWRRMIENINRVYGQHLNPDSLESFVSFSQGILKDLFNPEPGVTALDAALTGFASVLGKPTKGLERYVTQYKMLYSLMDARLTDTTLLYDDDIRLNQSMIKFYQGKQLDSIRTMVANIHPRYREVVFDKRNKTMVDSMQKAMKASTAFFAIGAGHLPGDNGVIEILKNKGFDVQPVFSSNEISITLMESLFKTAATNIRSQVAKAYETKDFIPPPPPPLDDMNAVKVSQQKKAPKTKSKTKKQ